VSMVPPGVLLFCQQFNCWQNRRGYRLC